MSKYTHHRMMILEDAERHLQHLHALRIQHYILRQHTQETRTTTQHTIALSKTRLREISEYLDHVQSSIHHSDF